MFFITFSNLTSKEILFYFVRQQTFAPKLDKNKKIERKKLFDN